MKLHIYNNIIPYPWRYSLSGVCMVQLLRVLWRVLRDRVSAHDELDMCVTRLQLTTEPSHMNNVATLARHEVLPRFFLCLVFKL